MLFGKFILSISVQPLKAPIPIVVQVDGNETFKRLQFDIKIESGTADISSGKDTDCKFVQFFNAPAPIDVTDDGIIILFKAIHCRKSVAGRLLTEEGSAKNFNELFLSKELAPIYVTLFGITAYLSELQYEKAEVEILVTVFESLIAVTGFALRVFSESWQNTDVPNVPMS